jgi:exodeoxyribonuclease VII large subunit
MPIPSISLLELSLQVKESLKQSFSQAVWIRAEISELHEKYNDHAYVELIEKDPESDRIIAKAKATCWASTYRLLKPFFESTTGEYLSAGMKVLISCTVEFHEMYGFSLNIRDIDPTYTIGDLAKRKLEILRRLENEGVLSMNKNLAFPLLPQRIAIISSSSAAGYGDFLHQLTHSSNGFVFYTKLFPATMQGDGAQKSIIDALDKVFTCNEIFDVVVIIRGGGATADLHCFNSYELAAHCTQFPLPVLAGIGHLRDETVLDAVAHESLKTPTAVAEYLIEKINETYETLLNAQQQIVVLANRQLQNEKQKLIRILRQLLSGEKEFIYKQTLSLNAVLHQLKRLSEKQTKRNTTTLDGLSQKLQGKFHLYITYKKNTLALLEKEVELLTPQNLLKKGYSLTLKNGKIVRSVSQVKTGDQLITKLHEGEIESVAQ